MPMTIPISSAIQAYSLRVELGARLNRLGFRLLSFFPNLVKGVLHKLFNEISLVANSSLEIVRSYTPEVAENELKFFNRFLFNLRKFAANIEDNKFLYDKELEEKVQGTLDKLYFLEGELRIKAFRGRSKPTSPEFINALSEKSKAAIAFVVDKN